MLTDQEFFFKAEVLSLMITIILLCIYGQAIFLILLLPTTTAPFLST